MNGIDVGEVFDKVVEVLMDVSKSEEEVVFFVVEICVEGVSFFGV